MMAEETKGFVSCLVIVAANVIVCVTLMRTPGGQRARHLPTKPAHQRRAPTRRRLLHPGVHEDSLRRSSIRRLWYGPTWLPTLDHVRNRAPQHGIRPERRDGLIQQGHPNSSTVISSTNTCFFEKSQTAFSHAHALPESAVCASLFFTQNACECQNTQNLDVMHFKKSLFGYHQIESTFHGLQLGVFQP